MIIIKHTLQTTATPAQIWSMWHDVKRWNTWDHELESSDIDGPFKAGTTGYIKFKNGTLLKTLLTQVESLNIFVQEAKLPFARVIMTHAISQANGKTEVTMQTEIRGPLTLFYALLLGSSLKKKIPIELAEMLKKAETVR